MIKKGLSEEEIVEKMVKKYDVKKERAERDVKDMIEELIKKGIVKR